MGDIKEKIGPRAAEELSRYDYELPAELIAQTPLARRDESRLLRLDYPSGRVGHGQFRDLADLLKPGDLLVINETQVIPARLMGRKKSGGRVEALILGLPGGAVGSGPVECLVRGVRGLKPGTELFFEAGLRGVVRSVAGFGRGEVEFSLSDPAGPREWLELLRLIGRTPLPPYVKRREPPRADSAEATAYQTVYARRPGAVAAPTAGLHFTPELLANLAGRGVEVVGVTLHVGYGTFEPLRVRHLETGRLHAEAYEISPAAAAALDEAARQGRRVVAVGSTVVRLLEHLARSGGFRPGTGTTDLFIRPGFEFRVVRAMVTNFHLPRTSLVMLVAALAGRENVLRAYAEAVALGYRFYSFGDAMFIAADRER